MMNAITLRGNGIVVKSVDCNSCLAVGIKGNIPPEFYLTSRFGQGFQVRNFGDFSSSGFIDSSSAKPI